MWQLHGPPMLLLALLSWHLLSMAILFALGRRVDSRLRSLKGLAYCLGMVNVGYVIVYGLILADAHFVDYAVSDWVAKLLH